MSFQIECTECGEQDILTNDGFYLLSTKEGKFYIELNAHSVQLIITCKNCGNKFIGGG